MSKDKPATDRKLSWTQIITGEKSGIILKAGLEHAAQNLSMMVGREITITDPGIETIPIQNVISYGGNPETEMVGVYLLIEGDLRGQALLLLSMEDAMYLVDLLMGEDPGETTSLDDMGQSALAEVGNLTLSGFLNTVASLTGIPVKPSPPAVVVDMRGSILTMVVALVAAMSDELIVIESAFKDADRALQLRFWILPEPALDVLNKIN